MDLDFCSCLCILSPSFFVPCHLITKRMISSAHQEQGQAVSHDQWGEAYVQSKGMMNKPWVDCGRHFWPPHNAIFLAKSILILFTLLRWTFRTVGLLPNHRALTLDWFKPVMVVSSFLPNEWFGLTPMRCEGKSAAESLRKFSLLMERNKELSLIATWIAEWMFSFSQPSWDHAWTGWGWQSEKVEITCFLEGIIEQLNYQPWNHSNASPVSHIR